MSTIAIAILVLLALAVSADISAFVATWAPGPLGDLDWFWEGHVSRQHYGVYGGAVSAALGV
jgi:hypothetical protein